MLAITLSILLGDSFLYLIKSLPNIIWSWSILIVSLTLIILLPAKIRRWLQMPLFVLVGLAWGVIHASWVLAWQLPAEFQSKSLIAVGTIASIPAEKNNQVNFIFAVDELRDNSVVIHEPTKIRLNWYFAPFDLHVGDRWQLQVRLKPPSGYQNLGSFDYEEWLFEQGIRATGYVQASNVNKLLVRNNPAYLIDNIRQSIADGIASHLHDKPSVGLVEALAVGERRSITQEQWDVLRATGTNHLFAIAGLHIGMLAAFVYFIVSFIWRRAGRLPLYLPAQQAAALGALLAAIWYSAQAGFSLPTQRAVIMTAVFLLATLLKRKLPLWQAWSLALLLILLFDPLAVLSASFWLSFGTVALIIYGVTGRLKPNRIWWHWGRPQWVIAVGLIPLSLLFFQDFSLVGFIANAIAIPWIGFIVLPLCLIGSILWLIWPSVSEMIFAFAEQTLNVIWIFLSYLAKLDWAQWQTHLSSGWILFSAIIAVCWWLAPRGMPARWLSAIWIMPLFLWNPAKPAAGVAWFNFLDTDKGVAAIVQTQQHTLVYESVPSSRLATSNAMIQSYLQYAGIHTIDNLIINRSKTSDSDQLFSLLAQMPVQEVMLNSEDFSNVTGNVKTCQQGQQWEWDGIGFEMLAPNFPLKSTSNCELRINSGKQNIVLSPELHKTNKTQTGMLRFELAPNKGVVSIRTFHEDYAHFWQRRNP